VKKNDNRNENGHKTEKETIKNNPVKKTRNYRNLNQINKKQNSENDDEINTDIGNWKMTKTVLNSHSRSSVSQIPDSGPSTGGLSEGHRDRDKDEDDSEDVTLKSLSVAVSIRNIQKNHNKEFTVYAGTNLIFFLIFLMNWVFFLCHC
jgi:hypothetical protein